MSYRYSISIHILYNMYTTFILIICILSALVSGPQTAFLVVCVCVCVCSEANGDVTPMESGLWTTLQRVIYHLITEIHFRTHTHTRPESDLKIWTRD